MEKEVKSAANIAGRDLAELLPIAAEIPIEPTIATYPLADANRALQELRRGNVRGAKVLVME
jgi:propanol-preferring alcohol dehydrogenase